MVIFVVKVTFTQQLLFLALKSISGKDFLVRRAEAFGVNIIPSAASQKRKLAFELKTAVQRS